MIAQVTVDSDTYLKWVELEKKLKECNDNFCIERYDGDIFVHSDNEVVLKLSEEVGRLKGIILSHEKIKRKFVTLCYKRRGEKEKSTADYESAIEEMENQIDLLPRIT